MRPLRLALQPSRASIVDRQLRESDRFTLQAWVPSLGHGSGVGDSGETLYQVNPISHLDKRHPEERLGNPELINPLSCPQP